MNNDEFGALFGMSYSGNENTIGNGMVFGFSIRGVFDFGVEYIKSSTDIEFSSSDLETASTLIYMGYNVKRKNNSNNLKLSAGYVTNSVNRKYYSPLEVTGVLLSVMFSLRIYDSEQLVVMPGIGLAYAILSVSENNYNNYSNSNSYVEDSRSLGIQLNFMLNISKNIHLIFAPSLSKDILNPDETLFIGIRGGLMLNLSNK